MDHLQGKIFASLENKDTKVVGVQGIILLATGKKNIRCLKHCIVPESKEVLSK